MYKRTDWDELQRGLHVYYAILVSLVIQERLMNSIDLAKLGPSHYNFIAQHVDRDNLCYKRVKY